MRKDRTTGTIPLERRVAHNDSGDEPVAEDVAAGNGERLLVSMVALEADVTAGAGMKYEHDQRRRDQRGRGGGEVSRAEGSGINKEEKAGRLAHIACQRGQPPCTS